MKHGIELNERNLYTPFKGKKHSEKSKQILKNKAKTRKRKKHSIETKLKIGAAHKNKIVSEKTRNLISQNHTDVSGENNPMFGKKHNLKSLQKNFYKPPVYWETWPGNSKLER